MYTNERSPQEAFGVLRLAAKSQQNGVIRKEEFSKLLRASEIPCFIFEKENRHDISDRKREGNQTKIRSLKDINFNETKGIYLIVVGLIM